MKKITDTYFALNGKKRRICRKTDISCCDKVIVEIIGAVGDIESVDGGAEEGITQIIFSQIDGDARAAVKATFGNVYKKTEDEYIISVNQDNIVVYTDTENGARYAACAIYSHYDNGIREGILYNFPLCEYRGMKVYIPSEDNLEFFRQFIDMCMYYGYNKLVLEIGGAMEYKKHPEINEGWVEFCGIMRDYMKRGQRINRIFPWSAASLHLENAGGSFLSQKTLVELCEYCTQRGIEIIPEVPSLSHSDYMLTKHPELAENQADPFPRSYCPSCDGSYELLFDILDEVIEVFHPKTIHIAHDEWNERISENCNRCAGKKAADVYAEDVTKIHDYLKAKGVNTMMWGDMLLDYGFYADGTGRGGGKLRRRYVPTGDKILAKGKRYDVYETLWSYDVDRTSEGIYKELAPTYRAMEKIPKDIKIMDWFCFMVSGSYNPIIFKRHGFYNVLGNLPTMGVVGWAEAVCNGVKGLSISNWSVLNERYMQRNGKFFAMVFAAMMLWNNDYNEGKRFENIKAVANEVFNYNYREIRKSPHVEIIHTSEIANDRNGCVDGKTYDDVKDKLGCYKILYDDGDQESVDILLGTNIGYARLDFTEVSEDGEWRTVLPADRIFSTTYTCDFIIDEDMSDEKIYYKFLISLKKRAKAVEAEILDQYKKDVLIKKITLKYQPSEIIAADGRKRIE